MGEQARRGQPEGLLLRLRDVEWLPVPNFVDTVADAHPRDLQSITSTVVLVASTTGELLLTQVGSRGWDVPGGHLELGESPLQAATRELVEETGLVVSCGRLEPAGYVRLHVRAARPAGYGYPYPSSYMVAWTTTTLRTAVAAQPGSECVAAGWFSRVQAGRHLEGRPWWPLAQRALQQARRS